MEFGLETDGASIDEVADILEEIAGPTVERARVATTNKVLTAGRTFIRKEIAAATGVPSREITRRMRIVRARRNRPGAHLWIGTVPVAVIRAGAKEIKSGGVSHRGPGGRVRNRRAFIATMRSGHTGVFERAGRKRLPIVEVRLPIHPAAVSAARLYVRTEVPERYPRVFQQEMQFRTQRAVSRRLGR